MKPNLVHIVFKCIRVTVSVSGDTIFVQVRRQQQQPEADFEIF